MKKKFVRFGGLSPLKQDHYETGPDKTFHNPPRKNGFYAFPWPHIEYFLLGSTDDPGHISNKSSWIRDDDGNLINSLDAYTDEYNTKSDNFGFTPKVAKLLKKKGINGKYVRAETLPNVKSDNKIFYLTVLKKPKTFDYGGEIWHHLGDNVKPGFILAASGSWVKTDMDIYNTALSKETQNMAKSFRKMFKEFGSLPPQRNSIKIKGSSMDHLEIFIEKL